MGTLSTLMKLYPTTERGAEECCVTSVSGARTGLVSDHSEITQVVDTYWLAV